MVNIPKVKLGNSEIEITRLISGGNPLCGHSHVSPEMSRDMIEYFTAEQVVRYLHDLQNAGINTIQARGDFHRILHWLELFKREGGELRFIGQTAPEMTDSYENIRVIAAVGAIGIYHHGTKTDNLWHEGKIDQVNDYLKAIRDTGKQVGLGTHLPEVIEYAEEKGWDIDFYMACFYNLSREPRESALASGRITQPHAQEQYLDDDPPRMCKTIRSTDKMCLAFKILAATRNCNTQDDVREAFRFAYKNIKPKDAVVVGMFPKYIDQINLNVQYAVEAMRETETELKFTQ